MAPPATRTPAAKAAPPVVQLRKGPAAKPPAPPSRAYVAEPKDPITCPLCIEVLDETDLGFNACPCGYRVCLFCVEMIKLHCRSLCPGCRREYGTPVPAGAAPGPAQPSPARSAAAAPPRGERAATPAAGGGAGGGGAGSSRQVSPAPKQGAGSQATKRAAEPPQLTKRMDDTGPGLPSGATWATQNQARVQQPPEPDRPASSNGVAPPPAPPMDDSAWPSLAVAAPPPPPPTRPQPVREQAEHRRSTSVSMSSADRNNSVSSSLAEMAHAHDMSQDVGGGSTSSGHELTSSSGSPGLPPHLSDAFATAQVTAVAPGIRRVVNVPLNSGGGQVEPYPEAAEKVAAAHQAIKTGTSTGKEASELMALLRQANAAAKPRAPPPGFGGPAVAAAPAALPPPAVQPASLHAPPGMSGPQQDAPEHAAPGYSSMPRPIVPQPLLTSQDKPVVLQGPPLGRYQPIAPPNVLNSAQPAGPAASSGAPPGYYGAIGGLAPVAKAPQQQQTPPPQPLVQPSHQQQVPGTYSMWSGLPGIAPLTSLWSGNGLGALGGSSSAADVPPLAAYAPIAKPPPPGFGHQAFPSAANGDGMASSSAGMSSSFRVGSTYNPLQQQQQQQQHAPQPLRYNPLDQKQFSAGAPAVPAAGGAGAQRGPPPGMSALYNPLARPGGQ